MTGLFNVRVPHEYDAGKGTLEHSLTRFTPANVHCFFGYYDIPAFDGSGERHLFHRVEFADRLPDGGDRAELWIHDFGSGDSRRIADTEAWNFQQGSLLQWTGPQRRLAFFNALAPDGSLFGRFLNPETGNGYTVSRPLANLSRDGRWGLSFSFARVYGFRPGYGYHQARDAFEREDAPRRDGVVLLDVENDQATTVLSLADIAGELQLWNERILVNHVTFNPSASRFVALIRNFATENGAWWTTVITANRDGSDRRVLFERTGASHYYWLDDETLIFWAKGKEGLGMYRVPDEPGAEQLIAPEVFVADGHCSLSPDGRWIINDSYPDAQGFIHVYLYAVEKGSGKEIGTIRNRRVSDIIDLRCDLHPRWAPDSLSVSIDSNHEGFRGVYLLDLRPHMVSWMPNSSNINLDK